MAVSRQAGLQGLTAAEAERRLRRDGPNTLPAPPTRPAWLRLFEQVVHFFAVLLWVAAGLALIAGLPELAVAIAVVILVNAVFAFVQEHRAEQAAQRLRDLLPRRVTVVRDGQATDIDTALLVIGDVVVLAAGDRVSADLQAVQAHDLWVDTATLTGESVPSAVDAGETLYAGTFVTEGEAAALVTATGAATRLAGIARLTRQAQRPSSPLTIELHRLVRAVAAIAVAVGAAFFVISLLIGTPVSSGFVFAIGVTVALVPEGLLPTVTLSLALGAQRMARRNALVRRLESVETLGSTTFICTDKTGTLTRNEMAVTEVWTPAGRVRVSGTGYEPTGRIQGEPVARAALRDAVLAAVRCSNGQALLTEQGWVARGDPMEAALDTLARRAGVDVEADRQVAPERRRLTFDPRRRRMSVVAGRRLLVKGAPDALLPRCRRAEGASEALEQLTSAGLRVIAVGARDVGEAVPAGHADIVERDLELLGLFGLEDPPRDDVGEAIEACRRAGIKVAMITGDHPETARAIASEVGLLTPEPTVLVGADLPTDPEMLGALVDRDGLVLARVAPEDKLRVARALRRRGHVVAMTGDGVNDGPALQEADIGVAMGRSGTDVAREAADLVLLDDHFATIVVAVEQGRATFLNVRRFLTYHLSDNVAELTPFLVWALSGGQFPLALGILQILALDIGTDTFSAVALGAEPPGKHILEAKPVRGRLLDRLVAGRAFGLLGPVEALFGMAAFVASLWSAGWVPGDPFPAGPTLAAASGATFAAVVFGQTANAFACRSTTRGPGQLGWFSNRLLVSAVVLELAITAVFLLVPAVARVLEHAPPPTAGWLVALSAAPAVLLVDAIHKAVRARQAGSHADSSHSALEATMR